METGKEGILLMNNARIMRTIERIAYQIKEDYGGNEAILAAGVKKRGSAVARCLVDKLEMVASNDVHFISLNDDFGHGPTANYQFENLPQYFEYIVLIDDVIFSGRTMYRAVQHLIQKLDPLFLRTCALVDRGHRMLHVQASFTGMHLPTKLNEHVQLHLQNGIPEKVCLTQKTT
jgi:pyrimidine operon attenuation protein/uracil phosphoribosyltransferase